MIDLEIATFNDLYWDKLADISCDDLSFDIDMLNIVSHKMITIEVSQMARWDKTK